MPYEMWETKKEDNEEIRVVCGWKLDWPDDNDNIALSAQTVCGGNTYGGFTYR